uniref:Uncharacterized protein n=1 Tax=Rhizophora mucronata TaxID=61149 RepID=A0A2P2IVT5_RHIMU
MGSLGFALYLNFFSIARQNVSYQIGIC